MVKIYGIPNCDTMARARRWLTQHRIKHEFHDYKKEGVDVQRLRRWIKQIGWEALLNRRGTSWRKLDDKVKAGIDEASAVRIMLENPSIIRRPVLEAGNNLLVGFKESEYAAMFD